MRGSGLQGRSLDKRRLVRKSLICLAVLAVVVGGSALVGHMLESSVYRQQEVRGDLSLGAGSQNTIIYEGQTYSRRRGLTSILFMGIDAGNVGGPASRFRNGGQADFLMLLLIDNDSKTLRWLPVDRDTITGIQIVGVLGNPAGIREMQIALSHGFGDGGKESCLYTVDAVEGLLMDIDINHYIALNMADIAAVNDLVGGVTLTLDEDFSASDPAMALGVTITLRGEQAEIYVRSRMNVGDGTNEARMARQQRYLAALVDTLKAHMNQDDEYIAQLFDALSDTVTTDLKKGTMVNIAYKAKDYTQAPTLSIPGEHRIDEDGFMEFIANRGGVEKLVAEVFYQLIQ